MKCEQSIEKIIHTHAMLASHTGNPFYVRCTRKMTGYLSVLALIVSILSIAAAYKGTIV
jgi:hypothetical protein